VNRWLTVLALAFTLAGCGGGDDSSASEDYASSVCGQLSMWVADQRDTLTSFEDAGLGHGAGRPINQEAVQTAVGDVRDSTGVLVSDLRQLDVPETDAGNQVKAELDNLGTTLTQLVDTVQQALDANTGVVALASTVGTALSTATNDVKSTLDELQDPDFGELKDAFQNSDECTTLRDQVENIGSGS
jgi:hypothetical protein